MGRDGAKRFSRPPRSTALAPLRARYGIGGGELIAASASGRMFPPSIDEGALTAVLPIGRPCDPPSDGQHPFTTIAPAGGAASPSKFGPIAPAPPEPERSAIQDSARQMPAPARLPSRDTAGTQQEQKRSKPLNLWRTRRDSNSRPLPSEGRAPRDKRTLSSMTPTRHPGTARRARRGRQRCGGRYFD